MGRQHRRDSDKVGRLRSFGNDCRETCCGQPGRNHAAAWSHQSGVTVNVRNRRAGTGPSGAWASGG